jgi:hypothetical protein
VTAELRAKSGLYLFYLDVVRPVLRSGRGVFGLAIVVAMVLMATVGPSLIPLGHRGKALDEVVPAVTRAPPRLRLPR